MEQRLAHTWQVTINEKKFIKSALHSDLRVDGRRCFDYRRLTLKFGRVDGSSEVQLGQTHVMGFVTSQLVQPYRERSNEGTLTVYTEFSPMADPSFEPGRPGEYAVELGRIIDRGLRESRAIDMESLCVIAGKLVWAIRIDLHILDNGGNLVDASNIAALAALLTFRRPDCTLEGEDGHEVRVHPPEVREPIPLIIHHLPIAVTFGFIGDENHVIIDPTHLEETVLEGKLTATLNTSGDICAIQKPGGVGVMQSVVTQCLRIASVKAADITSKIQKAVEAYNTERALKKVKRHPTSLSTGINGSYSKTENSKQSLDTNLANEVWSSQMERLKLAPSSSSALGPKDTEKHVRSTKNIERNGSNKLFHGGPSSWDPYTSRKSSDVSKSPQNSVGEVDETMAGDDVQNDVEGASSVVVVVEGDGDDHILEKPKTLKDAVKPKNKRKKGPRFHPPSPMDVSK